MILRVADLHTYIGEFHILQGVNLTVPEGKATVVLGRNGAGKTTLLRTIMGLLRPRRGEILLAGRSIAGLPAHVISRYGVGYVPEDRGIFGGLTVEENLLLAARGQRRAKHLARMLELFPELKAAWRRKAGSLSGGQKQMLAIGRALLTESRLLLIDEPSKGLAPLIVEKLAQTIKEIKGETTIVLVEQNFGLARAVGDFCTILDDGRSVWSGEMTELLADAEVLHRYLGIGGRHQAAS